MHTWLSVVTWYYSAYFVSVCLACLTQWAESAHSRGTKEGHSFRADATNGDSLRAKANEGHSLRAKANEGHSLREWLLRSYPWKVDSFFKARQA